MEKDCRFELKCVCGYEEILYPNNGTIHIPTHCRKCGKEFSFEDFLEVAEFYQEEFVNVKWEE